MSLPSALTCDIVFDTFKYDDRTVGDDLGTAICQIPDRLAAKYPDSVQLPTQDEWDRAVKSITSTATSQLESIPVVRDFPTTETRHASLGRLSVKGMSELNLRGSFDPHTRKLHVRYGIQWSPAKLTSTHVDMEDEVSVTIGVTFPREVRVGAGNSRRLLSKL